MGEDTPEDIKEVLIAKGDAPGVSRIADLRLAQQNVERRDVSHGRHLARANPDVTRRASVIALEP